jgi:hypothetical protein
MNAPREWRLPGGVILRADDVIELDERNYRFGRGRVRLRVEHVGDSGGNVHPAAEWVTVIGHHIDADGAVIVGRQLSARVTAIRPLPVTARVPVRPSGRHADAIVQPPVWPV